MLRHATFAPARERAGTPPGHGPDSAAAPAGPDPARMRRLSLVLLLAVGALLRLLQYGANRALWLDEALLNVNVLRRTPAELFTRPLDWAQTAPAGFLLLQKLAASLLGPGEYALRLVPLVAGLAALFWFPRVARHYVSRRALPLAVALFALAPFLVYYSSEAKQYALDVLAAVALLACATAVRHRPSRRALAAFGAAGAASVWLSQPAVFMLAGTGTVLGIDALRRRDARTVRALALVAAAWIASFAGSFVLSRNALGDTAYMRVFWRDGFPSASDPLWLPRAALRLFREPMGVFGEDPTPLSLVQTWAGAAAFAAGCAWMARRRGLRLALLLAPAGMALAAAALRLYPFGAGSTSSGRVLLFLLPALAMVAAEGTACIGRAGGRAGRAAAAVLALALLAPSLAYAAVQVPHVRAEVKPLLAYAAEQRQPGDVLYVHYGVRAPFLYYAPRYGWTPRNAVIGICSRPDPAGYLRDLEPLRGRRVWLLFIDDRAITRGDRELMLGYLEHLGQRVDDQVSVGAALYLYDLRQPPARPGPFRAPLPASAPDAALGCRGPWTN